MALEMAAIATGRSHDRRVMGRLTSGIAKLGLFAVALLYDGRACKPRLASSVAIERL